MGKNKRYDCRMSAIPVDLALGFQSKNVATLFYGTDEVGAINDIALAERICRALNLEENARVS